MLNIAFRVDSSYQMGIGHVMRCLTLAKMLQQTDNVRILFFCRTAKGNINQVILDAGFEVVEMQAPRTDVQGALFHSSWLGASQQEDARELLALAQALGIGSFDHLIVDHYGIDSSWHQMLSAFSCRIMVIDDLGDRDHDCDILLDQTFNCQDLKYRQRVPAHCRLLLGTEFALLRAEFQCDSEAIRQRRAQADIRHVLVMFGGSDPDNLSLKTLQILIRRPEIEKVSVIMGRSALHYETIMNYCRDKPGLHCYHAPEHIAELMLSADLAIGAAGTTAWERCACGLPSVAVIQAENQRQISHELAQIGVMTCLEIDGMAAGIDQHIDGWQNDKGHYAKAVDRCLTICDGQGSARVAAQLLIGTAQV